MSVSLELKNLTESTYDDTPYFSNTPPNKVVVTTICVIPVAILDIIVLGYAMTYSVNGCYDSSGEASECGNTTMYIATAANAIAAASALFTLIRSWKDDCDDDDCLAICCTLPTMAVIQTVVTLIAYAWQNVNTATSSEESRW